MIGPLAFLLLAGVVVMFDPLMVMGKPDWSPAERKPGIPAHTVHHDTGLRHVPGPRTRTHTRHHGGSRTPQNR
jgi:hypothetical protein